METETMSHLKQKLNQIPPLPGIYKMLDSTGQIIYVGKSKCLKKRVKSYFTKSPKQAKIERMVFFIADIDYIVTDTHLEARLLECQLIKELKPYFNSQMKNDRRYFYLKLAKSSYSHPMSIVLEREDDTFGPFRRKQLIQSMIAVFSHLFPIVIDTNRFTFKYHTLPEVMKPEDFFKNRESLIQVFSEEKKMQRLINQLTLCMNEEATQLNYERASHYRDLISGLTYINHVLHDYQQLVTSDILIRLPVRDGEKLFFVSKSNIILKTYFSTLTPAKIDAFLDEGLKTKSKFACKWDEKANTDFQNILFSEIQSLPEECILKIL